MRKYKTVKGLLNGLLKLWSDETHWRKGMMGSFRGNNMPIRVGTNLHPNMDPKECSFCFVGGLRLLSDSTSVNEKASCLIANNAFPKLNALDGKVGTLGDAEERLLIWNDESKTTLPQLRRKLASVIRKLEKDPSLGKISRAS